MHIESLPRGRRTFAFPQLTVSSTVPDPARRRSYEVAFVEADALARDIAGRSPTSMWRCRRSFAYEVELVEELPPDIAGRGFDISYQTAHAARRSGGGMTAIWMKVLAGKSRTRRILVPQKPDQHRPADRYCRCAAALNPPQ